MRKDLQHELRSREAFLSTLLFAVVVLLIFAFAFDPGPADIERVGPGILWSALLFAAVLAIGRSMLTEREDGAIDGLLLAPMQRSSIYVGKACALLLLLLSTQLPTLLLFVVFFDVPTRRAPPPFPSRAPPAPGLGGPSLGVYTASCGRYHAAASGAPSEVVESFERPH